MKSTKKKSLKLQQTYEGQSRREDRLKGRQRAASALESVVETD